MKKIGIVISTILLIALIAAVIVVSRIDVLENSKITEDAEYQMYLELKNKGELDENGVCKVKTEDPNKIRVTFAKNKTLDVEYFYDEKKTKKIDGTAFLNPGDTIYINFIETKGENKKLYKFLKYEVYGISDEGREKIAILSESKTHYTIPKEFKDKEIQIIPCGMYEEDILHLGAVCIGYDNIKESVYTGTWFSDESEIDGNVFNIGPSENYEFSYKYNANEYFFIGSTPQCSTVNQETGVVKFAKANSSDENKPEKYTVELKRYLKLNFKFDKKAKIIHNDEVLDKKAKKIEVAKIKFGDELIIETDGDIQITNGDYKYVNITKNMENGTNRYIISIASENYEKRTQDKICDGVDIVEDVTVILPAKDKFGTFTYEVDSTVVKDKYTFKEGDKLKVTYAITKNGYVFSEQNVIEKLIKRKSKTETIIISLVDADKTIDLSKLFRVEKEDNNE